MTDKMATRRERAGWTVAALIGLGLVPVLAGGLRLAELTGGAAVTPDNARFLASPVPILLHIVGVTVYTVLGAFQFVPRLRRRKPGHHRKAGRLVAPCGLVAALSGMWMAVFYALPEHDGPLLAAFRLVFGTAMAASIVLGLAAVRRRDFTAHRAWMIRGYAIGLGAGTQAFVLAPYYGIAGPPDQLARALLLGAGWVINLIVAEVIIQRWPVRFSS
ncbi:DUF2306 domain-containing protein [Nonomuraea sp. MCN248]|uniref:DUF2306 domain-containing protein n=1 Tax=Nonomuraea corallina TaxID=2989783 RepID=A0ABT4SC62_9ACTN|nr:DUF2306 domain-containing protein [Nonomuraea corallina]MDA0634782.1 DUF2306 domain-containing protein [Nonomuraea corallina]